MLVTWYSKLKKIELIGKGQKARSPISNFRSYLFSRPQLSTSPCGFRNICALTSTTITLHTKNKQRNKNKEQQEWRLSKYFSKYEEFLKKVKGSFSFNPFLWELFSPEFCFLAVCVTWRSNEFLGFASMINNLVAHNSAGDIHSLILMKDNKKNQMTNWLKKQKMQGTIRM